MALKKLEIKTIISNNDALNSFTMYLFENENKILVPIALTETSAHALIEAQNNKETPRPNVHNTMQRLITSLNVSLVGALIYKELEGIYYTYLRIEQGNQTIDIDSKATDAICVAVRMQKPILIHEDMLNKVVIKVTKELLETATNAV